MEAAAGEDGEELPREARVLGSELVESYTVRGGGTGTGTRPRGCARLPQGAGGAPGPGWSPSGQRSGWVGAALLPLALNKKRGRQKKQISLFTYFFNQPALWGRELTAKQTSAGSQAAHL